MSAGPHAIVFLAEHGRVFRLALTKVISVIGSAPEADVRLELPGISRRHCRITREAKGRYVIEDLDSVAGTFLQRDELEASRLVEEARLMPNDMLRLGNYELFFVCPGEVTTFPMLSGEKNVRLPQVCLVGRSDAGLIIADQKVSTRHASLETFAPDCVFLIDLGGGETTRNGTRVVSPCVLREGDVVGFAGHAFTFAHAGTESAPLVVGTQRRLSEALRYDAKHSHIVEATRDVAAPLMSTQPKWRTTVTRVNEAVQGRRGVQVAKIVAALAVCGLLAYPFHQTMVCECRVVAGAVQKIRAPVSGRVQKVYVQEGDKIRKDELLVRVVDRALQLEKSRADKELAAARDALERATADDRKYRLAELYARRDRAERESERVDTLLDQSDVRAGIAGRLMTPTPETLENVTVSIGQELLEVASTSHVYAEVLLPEMDIEEIVIGQPVHVSFYTDMSRPYDGEIEAVAPAAEKGALGSFLIVKAPLDNRDERLIPGTTGIAKIVGRRHPGIVLLFKQLARTFK